MRFDVAPAPITEDDAAIRAALEGADVAPLLVAVAQLTGDHDLLVEDLGTWPPRPWPASGTPVGCRRPPRPAPSSAA